MNEDEALAHVMDGCTAVADCDDCVEAGPIIGARLTRIIEALVELRDDKTGEPSIRIWAQEVLK